MPQYRDLSKKYEISASRYRELLYFCRQYDEKKNKVKDIYSLSGASKDGMPHGDYKASEVERKIEKAWKYQADIDLIDKCIKLACENNKVLGSCLLKNISLGISYEKLPVPMGRRQFYECRRKFFWILSREKG